MYNEFVKYICEHLDIPMPNVSYDMSMAKTPTVLAFLENNTIHINKNLPETNIYFAIIHELRHLWQMYEDSELYQNNYVQSDTVDVNEYNLQLAEVDANAFAAIMMIDLYGIKPTFENLSEEVRKAIEKRIEYILREEYE